MLSRLGIDARFLSLMCFYSPLTASFCFLGFRPGPGLISLHHRPCPSEQSCPHLSLSLSFTFSPPPQPHPHPLLSRRPLRCEKVEGHHLGFGEIFFFKSDLRANISGRYRRDAFAKRHRFSLKKKSIKK